MGCRVSSKMTIACYLRFVIKMTIACCLRFVIKMTIACYLRFVIKIRGWSVWVLVVVDVLRHLPHLHYIVLGDRADDPGLSWVPREVGDLGGVPAVDEEQLGRSVFCVLSVLLLPNLGKVPHVQAAICTGARQDGFVVGRPLHLEDLVLVRFK